MLSTASSSSSVFTFALPFLPFLPVDFGVSAPSSPSAALAFFGVLLAFLLGVVLSTPPVEVFAVAPVILVRFRVFQRARRELPLL